MYNVAVLVEDELSAAGAARVVSLNQLKTEPVMHHLLGATQDQVERGVERLEDLGQQADGSIADQPAIDALVGLVEDTGSQEVMILARRHVLAQLMHRDWPREARQRLDVPILHLISS